MILRKAIKVKIQGSKISKTHAREGGASVFTFFLFPKAAAPAKRAFQQAGKKEGGWGEGIFACLPKKQSPAALLVQSRAKQKNFLFLLEEKNRRAQNQKSKGNFSAGYASGASGGGAERQFRSKKFRAKFRISHQSQLSPFWESIASRLRRSAFGLCALRKAIKSHGGQKEKEIDLSFSYLK